jgi:hypothetical protein
VFGSKESFSVIMSFLPLDSIVGFVFWLGDIISRSFFLVVEMYSSKVNNMVFDLTLRLALSGKTDCT